MTRPKRGWAFTLKETKRIVQWVKKNRRGDRGGGPDGEDRPLASVARSEDRPRAIGLGRCLPSPPASVAVAVTARPTRPKKPCAAARMHVVIGTGRVQVGSGNAWHAR